MHIMLTPEEQVQALMLFKTKKIEKRKYLLTSGDISRNIYFVDKGCLRMFYTDQDAQEHTVCFYPENWWAIDTVSFFKEKPAMYSLQALEDSEVYYITLPRLEALFVKVPKFERFFRILTQNGFDMYERRVTSSLSKSATARYLEFRKQYPGLELRIAQKHIASYVGITAVFLSMMRKDKNL